MCINKIKDWILISQFFFTVFLLSCNTNYNEILIGKYKVYDQESKKIVEGDLSPTLTLLKNNEFRFVAKDTIIKGTWNSKEGGDWYLVTFDGLTDASLGGEKYELINIWNPNSFGFPKSSELVFKRIGK